MKFLLDQDVYAVTARFLVVSGHDVVLASEIGMSAASDEELLKKAQEQERIFITRDRDFGHLVFVKSFGAGVLYAGKERAACANAGGRRNLHDHGQT